MAEDITERASFRFKPLELPKGETFQTPQGRKLELLFQDTPVSREAPDILRLKSQAKELLGAGYDYFRNLAGEDFGDLSDRFVIKFVQGRFRHGGVLMHMDASLLRELAKNPGQQYTQDLVQSLVVHEIGHNLTIEEDIPMFAEMIYMAEKGQFGRIMEINRLFEKGKLEQAHVNGLAKIARWLGYNYPPQALTSFPQKDIQEFKAIFRKNLPRSV